MKVISSLSVMFLWDLSLTRRPNNRVSAKGPQERFIMDYLNVDLALGLARSAPSPQKIERNRLSQPKQISRQLKRLLISIMYAMAKHTIALRRSI